MPRVYVTLPVSDPNLTAKDRERLASFVEVVQHPGENRPTDQEKLDAIRDVDGIVIGRSGGWLTPEIIDAGERLRIVGVVGGAVGRSEPEYLLDRGLVLVNTGWAMSNAVAEFSVTMMLCGLRDVRHMVDVIREKGWGKARHALDLTGKSVGLIGFGMIGRRVAEFLAPFHCDVRVYDPYIDEAVVVSYGAQKTDLEDLLRNSFVVSLHLGLTDETRGMLGERELGWLPDNGLLVNTARAAVVDEGALVSALQSGRIRAALNVFWKEPLAPDHSLRDLDNVILTPHGGGLTHDTMLRHSQGIVDDLERFFQGEQPQNVVTREMLPRMT